MCMPARRLARIRKFEWIAAERAMGIGDKSQCAPAITAKIALRRHPGTAIKTARRQQGINQASGHRPALVDRRVENHPVFD